MTDRDRDSERIPEDLQPAVDWLRARRPEVSALDMDRIKQRTRRQALRSEQARRGRGAAPRRALSTVLSVLALTVAMGAAIAVAGKGPPSPSPGAGDNGASAAGVVYGEEEPGGGVGGVGEESPVPDEGDEGDEGDEAPESDVKGVAGEDDVETVVVVDETFDDGDDDGLPFTGSPTGLIALVGALMAASGIGLWRALRQR